MSALLAATERKVSKPDRGLGLAELVGATGATMLMLAASVSRGEALSPVAVVFAGVLGLLAAGDLRRGIIPNRLVYPALGVALAVSLFRGDVPLVTAVAGMAVASLPFLLLFIAAPGSIGGGDVKMAALVGAIVGFPAAMDALIAAVIVGGLAAVVVALRGHGQSGSTIPYGPFLAGGALLTML